MARDEKRRDPGEFYPGGKVWVKPGQSQPQGRVTWEQIEGKPQIAPLPDRYRESDMKGKINEIASKFATVVLAALIGWTAVADITVQKKRKDQIWNDEQVVVEVTESGVGMDTNAVRDIIREQLATNGIRKVDGAARPLPKYLHLYNADDSYPYAAAEYYRSRGNGKADGGCSSVRDGNFLCRNFDYPFDDRAEFVVKTSAGVQTLTANSQQLTARRYASIGVANVGTNLTESFVTSGKPSRWYKALPGATVDGINENGVVAEINVVDGDPQWGGGVSPALHPLAAVRWILDNATNAQQAATYIASHIAFPSGWTQNYHYMIADETSTFIVENGEAHPVPSSSLEGAVLTNFRLYPSRDTTGEGQERYDALMSGANITSQWWTLTYTADGYRASDLPGITGQALTNLFGYWASKPREAHRGETFGTMTWWQSIHTSVYDITNRVLRISVQETDDWYTFALAKNGTDEAKVREIAGEVVAPVAATVSSLQSSVSGLESSKLDGPTDPTLTLSGKAADALAVKQALNAKRGMTNRSWTDETDAGIVFVVSNATLNGESLQEANGEYNFYAQKEFLPESGGWLLYEDDPSTQFTRESGGFVWFIGGAMTEPFFGLGPHDLEVDASGGAGMAVFRCHVDGVRKTDTLALSSEVPAPVDIIDPASATTTGKAADALRVKEALAGKQETLSSQQLANIADVPNKANQSMTYTKTEVDAALALKRGMTNRDWIDDTDEGLKFVVSNSTYSPLNGEYAFVKAATGLVPLDGWYRGGSYSPEYFVKNGSGYSMSFNGYGPFPVSPHTIITFAPDPEHETTIECDVAQVRKTDTLALTSEVPAPYVPSAADPVFSNAVNDAAAERRFTAWVGGYATAGRIVPDVTGQWSPSSVSSGDCVAIVCGNGRLVAGSGSSSMFYSDNGITWTESVIPAATGNCHALAYGNGRFVAGFNGSGTGIWYSDDGVTWTASGKTDEYWAALAYGDGVFVAASDHSGIWYSNDGVTWARGVRAGGSWLDQPWKCVAYGNGRFVAGSGNWWSEGIVYSDDGVTWTQSSVGDGGPVFASMSYGDGTFVAGSKSGGIWRSADGVTWEQADSTASGGDWLSLAYSDGLFVAGNGSSGVWYSRDAVTWSPSGMTDGRITALSFAKGRCVAGVNGSGIWYSGRRTEGKFVPIVQGVRVDGVEAVPDGGNVVDIQTGSSRIDAEIARATAAEGLLAESIPVLDPVVARTDGGSFEVVSHVITTWLPDSAPPHTVEMVPTGTRNYKVFLPNRSSLRSGLPFELVTDAAGERLGVAWTNEIVRLPALVEIMEPVSGTIVGRVTYFDTDFDWSPAVSSAVFDGTLLRVTGERLHDVRSIRVGAATEAVVERTYALVSAPMEAAAGASGSLLDADGNEIGTFTVTED